MAPRVKTSGSASKGREHLPKSSKPPNFKNTSSAQRKPNKIGKRWRATDATKFRDEEAKDRFLSSFAKREVVPPRPVNLSFFAEEKLQAFEMMCNIGWSCLVKMDEKVYPNLVKLFYANAECDADTLVIKTYVCGKEIILDKHVLSLILGCDNNEKNCYNVSADLLDGLDGFDSGRFKLELTGQHSPHEIKANLLHSCDMKILHNYICQVVVPKAGGWDRVTQFELFLMWRIKMGKSTNLPHLILSHMCTMLRRKYTHLPYGMIITKVLHHFGINIDESEPVEKVNSKCIYGKDWLKYTSFIKLKDAWVKKGSNEAEKLKNDLAREAREQANATAQPAQVHIAPTTQNKVPMVKWRIKTTAARGRNRPPKNFIPEDSQSKSSPSHSRHSAMPQNEPIVDENAENREDDTAFQSFEKNGNFKRNEDLHEKLDALDRKVTSLSGNVVDIHKDQLALKVLMESLINLVQECLSKSK